jgi:hypothetical protein
LEGLPGNVHGNKRQISVRSSRLLPPTREEAWARPVNSKAKGDMNIRRASTDEVLQVHPLCLIFFIDETGHEEFADPEFPIFGMGGCGLLAAAIDQNLKRPWRQMKDRHFGGADVHLHASDLKAPTDEQVAAIANFFGSRPFGRFAVTVTTKTKLPDGVKPIQVMPGLLRRRWEELVPRFVPLPAEVAFIHEASERGDHCSRNISVPRPSRSTESLSPTTTASCRKGTKRSK